MGTKARDAKELDLDQQVNFLKKIEFFRDFDEHELRQFLSVSKWMIISENTLIIEEDSMGRGFYIVVQGEVSVFKTLPEDGSTVQLTTLTTGDCFGEMSLVTEIRRTAGVITTKNSFILMVEPEIISTSNVFLQLKFYKRFCEILVSRLIMANEKVAGKTGIKDLDVNREPAKEPDDRIPEKKAPPPKEPEPKSRERQVIIEKKPKAKPKDLPPMPEKKPRVAPASIRRKVEPEDCLIINPSVVDRLAPFLVGEVEDTRRFAELIQLDPILSYSLLQVANSPFFRRATQVTTVPHAMIAIGMKNVQEMFTELFDKSLLIKPFGGRYGLADSFWVHSVVVGRIAEMLKNAIRLTLSADVYLAGLLHDIGMIAIDRLEPKFYPQLLNPEPVFEDIIEAEREYAGVDHGLAGSWIAEKIGIPECYQSVMRFHHLPESARDSFLLVALVHLADTIAISRDACVGFQPDKSEDIMRSFAWVLIQEQHKPFMEVNLNEFLNAFNKEVDKAWDSIVSDIIV